MIVKFWGTRGSLPTPLKPEEVEEKIIQAISGMPDMDTDDIGSVRNYVRRLPPLLRGTVGGNTPCIEIRAGGETIIVDAGSGLHELGWDLMHGPCGRGQGTVHLLISHPHWDHLQGFPMFQPAFVPGNRIFIYGHHDIHTALDIQQHPLTWPVSLSYMQAEKIFVSLQSDEPFQIGTVRVRTIQSDHPGHSYSYRIEDQHSILVYASDAEYKQLDKANLQPFIDFFRNADALIFDSQYTFREAWEKPDWGHSCALIGADLARAAGVKKLVLFHHDPTYSDTDLLEIKSRTIDYQAQDPSRPFCEVIIAIEGLTLDLTPLGAVDLQLAPHGEATIVTPLHTFDKYGVDQIARQLARFDEQTSNSIIDFSQVETLTTAGLQALLALRQQREEASIILAAPSDNVRQVITLSGYRDYFAIYPSVDAALAAVHARETLNLPGQMIKDRYQIEQRIGQGRMGTVLKATDIQSNRPVALKILSPAFSQETIDRFVSQSRQVTVLDHPNIVTVFAWHLNGLKVEEFVAGPSLHHILSFGKSLAEGKALAEGKSFSEKEPPALEKQILSEGEDSFEREASSPGKQALSGDQAIEIVLDVARALEHAHSRGVVHGDLKPQNIFLTDSGVKLSGFGLGLLEQGRNLLDASLLLQSAPYLAPEQILGQPLDARTDLYALGVILYQLLTGKPPFEGSEHEVMHAHLHTAPTPPRQLNPQISLSQEHLVLKLLAKNPNERYASAQQARHVSSSLMTHTEELVPQRRSPLVGRQEQIQGLQACWQEALAGRGQLVFISGESGIGKTSLALQLAAQSETPVRLIGQGQERQGAPAYHLFSQILCSYFDTVPPEFFDQQARQLCAHFTQLVPHLSQMLSDLPDPAPLDPEHEQLRLMSSLTQFIKRATQDRPWLLILEDLQWADPSSLELLRYLGRHIPSMPILIIGIYRDTELDQNHPLREALRHLRHHPSYRHFSLDRLDQDQVGHLLADIWQQPAPLSLTQKIYQQTEGNPFFVEEVAKGLEDEGLVFLDQGRWHFPSPDAVRLPQSIREAVWQRIGLLSSDTQAILNLAAVLGPTFQFDVLKEMSGLSEWQVLEHIDMALERRLVHEVPGDTLLQFHHPAIRHVLYDDLGPLRRRLLHRQAGDILEHRAAPKPGQIAEELAHHFVLAGEVERALTYSIEAADQAQSAYANDAALMWHRRTLELLEQAGPERAAAFQEQKLSTRRAMSEVLTLVGRGDEALEQLAAAWSSLEAEADSASLSRRRASLCHQIGGVHERTGQYDLALEWARRGLSYLDEDEPTLELVCLYNMSGHVCMRQGNYEAAQHHLDRALALARTTHLIREEAESLRRLGNVSWYLGNYDQAGIRYEQALRIYRQNGDRQGEAGALNNLGAVAGNQSDYAGAKAFYEQTLSIYREIGDRQGEGRALGNLGVTADLLGDDVGGHSYYEQTLQICQEVGDTHGVANTLINLSIISDGQGRYVKARAYNDKALNICRQTGYQAGESLALGNIGLALHHTGDYVQAETYYRQALRIQQKIGYRRGETETLAHLGLLSHHTGDNKAAQAHSQQALHIAREIDEPRAIGFALTHVGHALAGLGNVAQARAMYEQARQTWQELGRPRLDTEPLAGLARLALAQGDLSQAQTLVEGILSYLQDNNLNGTVEPLRVYLTCYQVLRANQDPRAQQILHTAYNLLQERAADIPDGEMRHMFLENVAAHRNIIKAREGQRQDLPLGRAFEESAP